MNLIPFVTIWAVLAVAVLALAAYRQVLAYHEDDSVHLADKEAGVINQQVTLATRLGSIDRWGKALTVFEVAFGLALAGVYLYQAWLESTKMPPM